LKIKLTSLLIDPGAKLAWAQKKLVVIFCSVLGGSGMRRVMQTWYNRQNPQDLWRSTRGQSHHKAVLRKLHYKPADPGKGKPNGLEK
jgi:hypothetical protein